MSLKTNITEYLKQNGRITLDQLYLFCGKEHKKTSNAERRLRELMSPTHKDYNPNIKAERNAKGAITGYYWETLGSKRLLPGVIHAYSTCCNSWIIFKEHARDCQTLKVKENTLF